MDLDDLVQRVDMVFEEPKKPGQTVRQVADPLDRDVSVSSFGTSTLVSYVVVPVALSFDFSVVGGV